MRKRNITMTIRVTQEEQREILARMYGAASPSLTEFIIAMCRNGKIVVNEDLKELNKELRYQGNNLNQLVRLVHEGRVKAVNLENLLDCYQKLLMALSEKEVS